MTVQWKEGDVVQLKSGGPKMVVDGVIYFSDDSASVHCVWFVVSKKEECSFTPHALESSKDCNS
jgi:uncharacterized protein YodC (DUF2158 family)